MSFDISCFTGGEGIKDNKKNGDRAHEIVSFLKSHRQKHVKTVYIKVNR